MSNELEICGRCESEGVSGRPETAKVDVYVERQPDGSWVIDHVGASVDFWCSGEAGHYMEDAGPGDPVAMLVEAALGLKAG